MKSRLCKILSNYRDDITKSKLLKCIEVSEELFQVSLKGCSIQRFEILYPAIMTYMHNSEFLYDVQKMYIRGQILELDQTAVPKREYNKSEKVEKNNLKIDSEYEDFENSVDRILMGKNIGHTPTIKNKKILKDIKIFLKQFLEDFEYCETRCSTVIKNKIIKLCESYQKINEKIKIIAKKFKDRFDMINSRKKIIIFDQNSKKLTCLVRSKTGTLSCDTDRNISGFDNSKSFTLSKVTTEFFDKLKNNSPNKRYDMMRICNSKASKQLVTRFIGTSEVILC